MISDPKAGIPSAAAKLRISRPVNAFLFCVKLQIRILLPFLTVSREIASTISSSTSFSPSRFRVHRAWPFVSFASLAPFRSRDEGALWSEPLPVRLEAPPALRPRLPVLAPCVPEPSPGPPPRICVDPLHRRRPRSQNIGDVRVSAPPPPRASFARSRIRACCRYSFKPLLLSTASCSVLRS